MTGSNRPDHPAVATPGADPIPEIPTLAPLPHHLIEELAHRARTRRVAAGEVVMREGSTADEVCLVLAGEVEVTRQSRQGEVVLAVLGRGAVLGEMSVLERGQRTASVRALRETELLVIEAEDFEKVLERSPAASLALLRTVRARLRGTEASLVHHAKLASLGTLAAGLAHELNNPTTALQRGLPQLQHALLDLDRHAPRPRGRVLPWGVDPLAHQDASSSPVPASAPPGSPATSSVEAQDLLVEWLEDQGFESARHIGPALFEAGWTPARLEPLLAEVEPENATDALHWMAARCTATTLINALRRSAGTIAEIVGALKAHSALGQSDLRETDIVRGLEAALVVLRGRLHEGTRIVREYDPDLPRVETYGAELNHVWTNLIDNALDAMAGHGTLELRASTTPDGVEVQVIDSGPGIEESVRPRIFDPFFTTKAVGEGTGLGLHVVYSTVRRHAGSVEMESRPGRTAFIVRLPARQQAQA